MIMLFVCCLFLPPFAISSVSEMRKLPGVWHDLRDRLQLAPNYQHTMIDEEVRWLVSNPDYLYRVTRRSQPYIRYILDRVTSAGMPAEIALLPIVESAYDPFAYSPGRAAGLWQFIPSTANHFDLEQNWWYDGRRDVVAATDAAISYLGQLHERFDDWLLALAAYNGGQARLARAIGKNEKMGLPTDYWSLSLPNETLRYVPRLIAIAKVIQNPTQYGVKLFPVGNQPYFAQVDTGGQIDLAQAAQMAGVDIEELYQLNPGFSRWATPPAGPHRLLLPATAADKFSIALNTLDPEKRIAWHRYEVMPGDTLSQIAQKYATSTSLVAKTNGIKASNIRAGQHIMIPVASKPESFYVLGASQRKAKLFAIPDGDAVKRLQHRVAQGESWWSIARHYGVSHSNLARWNGKAPGDLIRPGEKLVVKLNTRSKDATRQITRKIAYKVRSGDNLSKIAKRFEVNVSQLVRWNGIDQSRYLQPGDNLSIHVAVTGSIY